MRLKRLGPRIIPDRDPLGDITTEEREDFERLAQEELENWDEIPEPDFRQHYNNRASAGYPPWETHAETTPALTPAEREALLRLLDWAAQGPAIDEGGQGDTEVIRCLRDRLRQGMI